MKGIHAEADKLSMNSSYVEKEDFNSLKGNK
jgi:hypothetical protein